MITTKTNKGEKIDVGRATYEGFKIGTFRISSKVLKICGVALYPAAVISKTAYDTIPYGVDKLISNATFGNCNLSSLVDSSNNLISQGVPVLIAGISSFAIYAGIKYGVFPLLHGSEKIGEQATSEASNVYREDEPIRQAKRDDRVQKTIEKIVSSSRTGAV